MTISSFFVKGSLIDGITGPMGALAANMKKQMAGIAKSTAAMNKAMNASVMTPATTRLAKQHAANLAIQNKQLTGMAKAYGAMAVAQNRMNRASGGGGGGRAGRGFMGRQWGHMQMGLAALGQKGYALGRGGPSTLLTLGSAYGAYAAVKQYAQLQKATANIAKTLNLSAKDTDRYMKAAMDMGAKYGQSPDDVASTMWKVGQSGITGYDRITKMAEQITLAAKVWDGTDTDLVGETFGRMASIFYPKDLADSSKTDKFVRNLGLISDAVNHLEETSPATSKEIVPGVLRAMGGGQSFGLSPHSIAGTIGTMQGFGEPSGERAGSRMRILWQRLASYGGAGTKKQQGAMNKLFKDEGGMSPKKWEALRSLSPEALQLRLFGKLASKTSTEATAFLSEFMGQEAAATTATLVNNYPKLAKGMAEVSPEISKMVMAGNGLVNGSDALFNQLATEMNIPEKNLKSFREEVTRLYSSLSGLDPSLINRIKQAYQSGGWGNTTAAGSTVAEYERQANTLAAGWDRARASFEALMASLGKKMEPEAKTTLTFFENFFKLLRKKNEMGDDSLQRSEGQSKGGYNTPGSVRRPWSYPGMPALPRETPNGEAMEPGTRSGPIHRSPDGTIKALEEIYGWGALPGTDQGPIGNPRFKAWKEKKYYDSLKEGLKKNRVGRGGGGFKGHMPPPSTGAIMWERFKNGNLFESSTPPPPVDPNYWPGPGAPVPALPKPQASAPASIPLTIGVVQGGHITITAKVDQLPSVIANPGAAAQSGGQHDGMKVDGTAT